MTAVENVPSAPNFSRARLLVFAIAAAAPLVLPHIVSSFTISLVNLAGIYALATLGLILLTGSGGVTSFAQATFMGIGAYASAFVCLRLGLNPWLGLIAALVLVAVCAAVMGALTLHLGGHYLPITTLAWAVAIYMILGNLKDVGGHSGIGDIPAISIAGIPLDRPERIFYLVWAILALGLIGAANLLNSRQGRAISALRGGAILAESLGISAFRMRMMLFMLAAELAAVAGWLFAHTQFFISPTNFDLSANMQILLMSVLGGVSNVLGAVAGAVAITFGRNWIQDLLPSLGMDAGTLEVVVFGAIFILLVHFSPRGLSPLLSMIVSEVKPGLPRLKPEERLDFAHAGSAAVGTSVLELDAIEKRFGGLVAVKALSFTVEPGTVTALIGPNGAGKSTTFDLISGLKTPSSGTVRFLGREISGTPARNLISQGLARTFQHVKLRPHMSLLQNVMLGAHWRMKAGFLAGICRLDRAEEERFRRIALLALKEVGLDADPYGCAGNLALGRQRLLEIARALAADPVLVIVDEPAAGLRAPEKQALAQLLRRLRGKGVTILLVEHDMEFVMGLADKVVVLEFGRRLAVGLPSEIRKDPKVQEAYLGGIEA